MSVTALAGGVGLGLQTAKDTPVVATSLKWVPATSIDLDYTQRIDPYPFEVGGAYWQRNAYKGNVSGAGGWTGVARPSTIGYLLKAFFGSHSQTANADGTYTHTFQPRSAPATAWGGDGQLQWVTLVKNVATMMAQQFVNAKCRSLRLNMPAAALATYTVDWVAALASSAAIDINVPAMDFSNAGLGFTTCDAVVTLDTDTNSGNARARNIVLTLTNNLSTDEQSVGNFYLDDVTLLSRAATVQYDLVMRDPVLWRKTYRLGALSPSDVTQGVAGGWSPKVYVGSLTVKLRVPGVIGTGTQETELSFTTPYMNFMAFPTGLQGNDLVRVTLTGQILLSGPAQPVTMSLIDTDANGTTSYSD